MHLDRQASSESASEHIWNAFGSTSAERERICEHGGRIWVDKRRATADLDAETFFGPF